MFPSPTNFNLMNFLVCETGNMAAKTEFLQPNISAGRPISRPVTKPDSITGGIKIAAPLQRFPAHGPTSGLTAGDHHDESNHPSFKFAASDRISPQPTGKQGNFAHFSSSTLPGEQYLSLLSEIILATIMLVLFEFVYPALYCFVGFYVF